MGIGKSIREEAEVGYWWHCGEAARALWSLLMGNWGTPWEALCVIANWLVVVLLAISFPLSIPLGGWTRMRYAKKRMAQMQGYKERMHSRVQRNGGVHDDGAAK